MTPEKFREDILRPALERLAPIIQIPHSLQAENFLLAIAIQESALAHRYQVLDSGRAGPARGWWQFEAGGGVHGVLHHPETKARAQAACAAFNVQPIALHVWRAIEGHDVLAVAFARLLLWSDPAPLPTEDDMGEAWAYYERNWRPGKPHPETWSRAWARAHGWGAAWENYERSWRPE